MEKSSFVIMPFSSTNSCSEEQWTEIFDEVFRPAFIEIGFSCERASPETGSLIKSIVRNLQNSFIVLADITDRNANVFYELGVRHALSRRTIIVAQDPSHIPSDLKGYWSIIYSTNPKGVKEFKLEIKRIVEKIESDPTISDSPVSDFIDGELYGLNQLSTKPIKKKLVALRTELTGHVNTLAKTKSDRRYSELLDHQCLDLFTSTFYVDLGSELVKKIYQFRVNIKVIRSNVDYEQQLISNTIGEAEKLIDDLDKVINTINSGEFKEPLNITATTWIPIADQESEHYSRLEDFKFDPSKSK